MIEFLLIAISCQLVMTGLFAREALTTDQGKLCVLKCTGAALMYLLFSLLLAWGLRGVLMNEPVP